MLRDAISKSRSLSHELSPAVMHHGDFAETLRWLANEVQAKHGLVVHVQAAGEVHAESEAIKSLLYRAAQELLFNVVKHARVKEARINIRKRGRCIYVSVSDCGCGFDPQDLEEDRRVRIVEHPRAHRAAQGPHEDQKRQGKGSRFSIIVPAREQVLASPPSEAEATLPGAAIPHAERSPAGAAGR